MPKQLRCLLKIPHLCISSSKSRNIRHALFTWENPTISINGCIWVKRSIFILRKQSSSSMFVFCNVGYFTSQPLLLSVAILIMYSFSLCFKMKLWLWSDMWEFHLTIPQILSLLTCRWNPLGWQLSHHSLSPVPHLQSPGSSCFLSAVRLHQYSLLHTPKSTWRSLLAYPFWFLEMSRQLCILRPT